MAQSEWARCASAIRKELKQKWPDVKFRVRSDSFAGGDSVSIHWTDGPTQSAVKEITDKYQYGNFNGMIDMYEMKNDNLDIPRVKYVLEQRSMSEETREALSKYVEENYAGLENFDLNTFYPSWNQTGRNIINRLFIEKDFTKEEATV
jgi:hypothetical protein